MSLLEECCYLLVRNFYPASLFTQMLITFINSADNLIKQVCRSWQFSKEGTKTHRDID